MKKFGVFIKILSVVLALAVLTVSVPIATSAAESKIRFGVISDIHYFGNALKGNNCEEYQKFMSYTSRQFDEQDMLLDAALDGVLSRAADEGATYVLIPGDLTKDGELVSHQELAARLESFERETGIQVYVIPGNHDINNSNAISFETGVKTAAATTSPEQFYEIYDELGYGEADSCFVPAAGNKGGMLSYAISLEGNYRLLALDTCMYSEDNGAPDNEHLTDGIIGDDLMVWIKQQCAEAAQAGETVIAMEHHNVIPHNEIEESTFWAFVNADWQKTADALADAGIHYVFTGHLHANDIVTHVSDNGEQITDILTSTITGYPNKYRIVDFTSRGPNDIDCDIQTINVDEDIDLSVNSTVYSPYRYKYSFGQTFGHGDMKNFVMKALEGLLQDEMFEQIQSDGLYSYLQGALDLQKIITDALGTNGLAIGSIEILTVSQNLMAFIEELCGQVDKLYLNDLDDLRELASWLLDELLSYEPSDEPATAFSEYGFGSNGKPGTLNNLAQEVILYYYDGNEDISNNPFMLDVLDSFENGDGAKDLFSLLRTVLINKLIEGELLSKLSFNAQALFPDGTLLTVLGRILSGVIGLLLKGDTSYLNTANFVLGILGYDSIDGILDALVIEEYLTDSQFEAWGHTISWMLSSLVTDTNPAQNSDDDLSVPYNGPVEVEATVSNFRLPSNIAVTFGDDSATTRNINWYTKYGVDGTDIELITYSETPVFTGTPTTDSRVKATEEVVTRGYPGADLGIFGLFQCSISYIYHHIELTGLTPGTKYLYRVGDAQRGWWSETGVIETADNSDSFSFIHLTDMQSQNEKQYKAFASVLDAAYETCPDAKFIVSSGDNVDLGTNFKQWSFMLNASPRLKSTAFMPATGNHEDEGDVFSTVFNLPGAPEQETESGVFYSYDYNNAHFIVLNTNDIVNDELSAAQLEWLKADACASDAQWKIVVLHKALYSNGSHYDDKDVVGMRKQLCALLPELGVDLVLQGHDHVYLRTDVLNANMVIPSSTYIGEHAGLSYQVKMNPKGTIYSIPGTSGVKVYSVKDTSATDKLFPRAEALVESDHPIYSTITVEGGTLYFDAYKLVDGKSERIDSFAIQKTDGSSNQSKMFTAFMKLVNSTSMWRLFAPIVTIFSRISQMFTLIK